jgi:tripartite-type tricarboxylate transporter receptor subunit TctC
MVSEQLHQPFVVENRPGASTNIATEAVIRAPADGYTILLGGATNAINATLYETLTFNFMTDLAPVAGIIRFPNVMEVNPAFSAKTVPEFIAYAKVNPGKINMGSTGKGTSQHLSGELFKMMTGVDLVHVPYRGGSQALTDLLSGHVQVSFEALPPSLEFIKSGKLRALAVTTATRSEVLPDQPTVGDFVPDYEASGWNGVCAPKNTPIEIIEKLNKQINAGLADPKMKAKLAALGGMVLAGSRQNRLTGSTVGCLLSPAADMPPTRAAPLWARYGLLRRKKVGANAGSGRRLDGPRPAGSTLRDRPVPLQPRPR